MPLALGHKGGFLYLVPSHI
jgi:hypothetical protein